MEVSISKVFSRFSYYSWWQFVLTNNVLKEYNEMKEE